jgi:ankyrin repeat protein
VALGAFELAVIQGDREAVASHLASGADPNGCIGDLTVLMSAAEFPRADVVELLLDAGAEVNTVATDGRTALLNAIWSAESSPDVVAALVKAGADQTIRDANYGMTAREWAVEAQNHDVVAILDGST